MNSDEADKKPEHDVTNDLSLDEDLSSGDLSLDDEALEAELEADFDGELDEELDAALDEDWDAFDDEELDDTPLSAPARNDAMPATAGGQTSFVSKYFNVVVIGLAVVIGGWVVVGQLSGDPSAPAPVQTATALVTPAPAMPAVTAGAQQQEALEPIDLDLDSLRNNNAETVAQLPYEEELDAVDSAESLPETKNVVEDVFADFEPAPLPEDDIEDLSMDAEIADAAPAMPAEPFTATVPEPVVTLTPLPENTIADAAPVETMPEPVAAPQPVVDQDAVMSSLRAQEAEEKARALEEKLAAAENDLKAAQDENADLSNDLKAIEEEAQSYQDRIAELEKALDAAKAAKQVTAAKETTKAEPPPAPKETAAKAPEKPKVVAKTQLKPAPKAAPKVVQKPAAKAAKAAPPSVARWSMRSAQPGSAMLADAQSGNMIKVEIGQTVPGLGVIDYIGFKDGKWVVQGNKGSIER